MRIAVTYDAAASSGPADVAGVRAALEAVVASLGRLGHAAFPVAVDRPLGRVLPRLETVDLVFNLVEGLAGRAEDEPRLAALQELAGPPVTGARSDALALARRKDRVNILLEARGVPVPRWIVVRAPARRDVEWTRYPAIVKPVGEDGSVGIHDDSVVDQPWQLEAVLARSAGDVLVQEFVGGRELNVGLVGDHVLPVAEITFQGAQRLVSYAAKWDLGSEADRATPPVCPARLSVPLHDAVVALAREAWAAVGGSGYGRVDLRTDANGRPHVLDVNPNPDLAPGAGLARMADTAGWGYDGLVARIVEEAVR